MDASISNVDFCGSTLPSGCCTSLCLGRGLLRDRIEFVSGLLQQSPWAIPVPWELSFSQWLGCITLSGTWIGYLTGEPQLCFPMQSWTLCYEEQFYAVVGLLLALSGTKFFRIATILTASIVAIDAAALMFHVPIHGVFFDEHWLMFAAGVGVYWALNCATPRQSAMFQFSLIGAIIGLGLLASRTSIFGEHSHVSGWRVVAALGFALVLTWLKRYDEKIVALTSLNWLKSCGIMCYSIYLVHLVPAKLIGQSMRIAGYDGSISILFICVPARFGDVGFAGLRLPHPGGTTIPAGLVSENNQTSRQSDRDWIDLINPDVGTDWVGRCRSNRHASESDESQRLTTGMIRNRKAGRSPDFGTRIPKIASRVAAAFLNSAHRHFPRIGTGVPCGA